MAPGRLMGGFERFQHAMLTAFQKQLETVVAQHKDELGAALKNDIFDLDGPREVNRIYAPHEYLIAKHFRSYLEINRSIQTLEDIEFYVRRFPFQKTHIKCESYLQFHIECYFSELYILRERLTTYFKLVQRLYRKEPKIQEVNKICTAAQDAVDDALRGVTTVRSSHVHQERFTDKEIERLDILALLANAPDQQLSEVAANYYKEVYRAIKKKWSTRIKTDIGSIKKLLDVVFGALHPIIFDEPTGNIHLPKTS